MAAIDVMPRFVLALSHLVPIERGTCCHALR
jgi:hypothetical protein